MDAIIVSGMPAVGKTTVSKTVAEKLHLKVVGGGDVLKEMAIEEGFTPGGEDWWDTDDGMNFLKERKRSPNFDREVDERLLKKAKVGNVVITSYTLPWLSKYGTKVWLAGSVKSRAARMSKRDHVDERKCREIIAFRDKENRALYKKIYGIDFGKDLTPFDLVVETDHIPEDKVARIVLEYVRGHK
ncbi:MAG: cytidylate kinase family protein [Thaumarchaeota archaeon]|nr:cytidylate kinase family protein [Nitrososphaerota archaeon]